MKKLLLLLAITFSTVSIFADDISESQVPTNIKSYVYNKYSAVNGIEWEYKAKKGYYKAEFRVDGREVEIEIYTNGKLKELKEDLFVKDLPKIAVDYIKKNYADAVILGGKKKIYGTKEMYNIGFKFENSNGRTRHRNIDFDVNGKVLRVH